MTKSLMISKQPQEAVNLLNGDATLDLRTWIPKDYVGWVYIYVAKGVKDILHKYKDKYYTNHYLTFTDSVEVLNSKVVARFWFDEYDTLEYSNYQYIGNNRFVSLSWYVDSNYLDNLCLDYQDVLDYGFREKPKPHQKTLYAWHINKLEIFDEPKQLSDFYKAPHFKLNKFTTENIDGFDEWLRLEKAPKKSVWIYGN